MTIKDINAQITLYNKAIQHVTSRLQESIEDDNPFDASYYENELNRMTARRANLLEKRFGMGV